MDQVTDLLRQGRKLEAIRAYRQWTGGTLQQALDAINALESGQLAPAMASTGQAPPPGAPLADWEQEAVALVQQNRKIEAVKLVRQRTGQDLRGALATVAALETRWLTGGRPPPPTGDPIRDLLQQGRKIDAIKRYMAEHRVGLKQAKDTLDAMEREMGLR